MAEFFTIDATCGREDPQPEAFPDVVITRGILCYKQKHVTVNSARVTSELFLSFLLRRYSRERSVATAFECPGHSPLLLTLPPLPFPDQSNLPFAASLSPNHIAPLYAPSFWMLTL